MTKVSEPHQAAGVKCPKKTGDMDEETSCKICHNYRKCMGAIWGVLL